MMVFPVLIPGQNFLFPGTGREGKFEACIPGNHGKREFLLTPGLSSQKDENLFLWIFQPTNQYPWHSAQQCARTHFPMASVWNIEGNGIISKRLILIHIWSNNNCPCIKIRRKQAIKYPFKTQSWPKIGTVDIVDNGHQFIFQEIMQRTWKLFCCGDLCFY